MSYTFFETLNNLPLSCYNNKNVFFRLIQNEEDLGYAVIVCKLKDEQKDFVNPAGFSIGRAYLNPDNNYPCVICSSDGTRIGFINLIKWLGKGEGLSWSFYIDKNYQGKGFGTSAAKLAISILKTAFPNETIKLSTETYNVKAIELYSKLGFKKINELDGNDLVFAI